MEEALELMDFLKNHNITCELEDTAAFDVTFSGNPLNKEFRVKLKQSDFEPAEELLINEAHASADQLPSDHYLLSFTDEELIEIVSKPDEWSAADYKHALQLLKDRGKEFSAESVKAMKKQRYDQLAKPEESKPVWIYVGFISAILGGLIGIFIGWHLLSFKKTLPNGQRVYGYTMTDRKRGQTIFFLGLFFAFLWLLVMFSDLENLARWGRY
jgi:hypothetical protein